MKTFVDEIATIVARAGTHPVWGYAHCRRVYALAGELALSEGVSYDAEILHLAALLHDIGLYKAYALRDAPDHAQRSAVVAGRLLRDGDFPPQATRVVLDAIKHHPPGVETGSSMEAALLKDAVALDYLGAVGVSRVLAMVGVEEDVPDLATAVRHAQSLHQNIPELLLLEASKEIARDRRAETENFIGDLSYATENLKLL